MNVKSIDPYTGAAIGETAVTNAEQLDQILQELHNGFKQWKRCEISERIKPVLALAQSLQEQKNELGLLITREMGKPLKEAIAEVEKCGWLCEYYAQNAPQFLRNRIIDTDAQSSFVRYDPLGVILGVMPWNFPFWQVFRFAIPTLIAGNTVMLKHASNVSLCSIAIEKLFHEAGCTGDKFKSVIVPGENLASIIKHDLIRGVSLTGSEAAGSSVASIAGKHIKPSLLELGGSNAFLVMPDADLQLAVEKCLLGRMLNAGQSCIAAKRLLIASSVYDTFKEMFIDAVKSLGVGDPKDEATKIGPLARESLATDLEQQLKNAVSEGARLLYGGRREGALFYPTVLEVEDTKTCVMQEETFGPLAVLKSFDTFEESVEIVADSGFGLGMSIFTKDPEQYLDRLGEFNEGAVFFNEIVKSDPRLPFGGVKNSGYGRELSEEGIKAFVNAKTVYIS